MSIYLRIRALFESGITTPSKLTAAVHPTITENEATELISNALNDLARQVIRDARDIALREKEAKRKQKLDHKYRCPERSPKVGRKGNAWCKLDKGHDGPHSWSQDLSAWEAKKRHETTEGMRRAFAEVELWRLNYEVGGVWKSLGKMTVLEVNELASGYEIRARANAEQAQIFRHLAYAMGDYGAETVESLPTEVLYDILILKLAPEPYKVLEEVEA